MIQRQRESVARYLYDASKIVFATAVVGNFVARTNFDMLIFLAGVVTAACCFGGAYLIEGMER